MRTDQMFWIASMTKSGTRYLYSNSGTNVGARIVEVVTGIPFEKFLDEGLLIPLGMTDTTFWLYPERELATLFMVQHQGYAGDRGDQIAPAFEAAAVDSFAIA